MKLYAQELQREADELGKLINEAHDMRERAAHLPYLISHQPRRLPVTCKCHENSSI